MNDDVFEWRLVAARLRSGWRAVTAIAALAFVLGAGLSLARDDRYVAEALLAVTKPAVVAEFDQRLAERQLDPSFPYDVATLRAYAELATTQALGHDVARRLDAGPADVDSLLRRISVEAMADGSLLQIRARAADSAAASKLANAWSEALVERASLVFGSRLADDGVRAQRDEAEGALASAQAALNEFHRTSRLPARELEHESLTFAYQEALAHDRRLEQVLLDIETLRAQAGTTPGTSAALAALSLRLRALSASQPLPVDLQLGADGLAGDLGPDAIDALREAVLEARQRLGSQLDALPGRLSAQRQHFGCLHCKPCGQGRPFFLHRRVPSCFG